MSLGYAERLSYREDLGGQLGAPEIFDQAHLVKDGVEKIAELVRKAQRVVAFTGAGISTACGIPDFRGPSGVWTLQRAGKDLPKLAVSFTYAKPSLTHMALLGLMQARKLVYICSQNVDSLHLRSGVPRDQLAELHGNCFAERCEKCRTEYVRDFEMDTVGFKLTGRKCTKPGCPGALKDHILDWEDGLPPKELKRSQAEASDADVSLCLGTSLQITPACNIPERTIKGGGSLVIINLQATQKDKQAAVVLHTQVDVVMAALMHSLNIPIPQYTRTDMVRVVTQVQACVRRSGSTLSGASVHAAASGSNAPALGEDEGEQQRSGSAPLQAAAAARDRTADASTSSAGGGIGHCDDGDDEEGEGDDGVERPSSVSGLAGQRPRSWRFTLSVESPHGRECAMPMVQAVEVQYPGQPWLRPARITGAAPFSITCEVDGAQSRNAGVVRAQVRLLLVEAADPDKRTFEFDLLIHRDKQREGGQQGRARTLSFVSQVHGYTPQQQQLVGELEERAAQTVAAAAAAGANGEGTATGASGRSHGGSGGEASAASDAAPPASKRPRQQSSSSGAVAARYGESCVDREGWELGPPAATSSGRLQKRTRRLDL